MGDDDKNFYVENMRFYGSMRFKQLTLMMAGMTVAGAAVVQFPGDSARALVSLVAMGFTAVLWIMEVRSSLYWVANREKAPGLWPRPVDIRGASMKEKLPSIKKLLEWTGRECTRITNAQEWLEKKGVIGMLRINATNAVLVFYAALFVLWWCLLYTWEPCCASFCGPMCVFGLLLVFSALSYLPLWKHSADKEHD